MVRLGRCLMGAIRVTRLGSPFLSLTAGRVALSPRRASDAATFAGVAWAKIMLQSSAPSSSDTLKATLQR